MTASQFLLDFAPPNIPDDRPRFAEFFAGIGLMRMGLEAAGWQIAFANDIDPKKMSMYNGHFGDAARHFVLGDIHDIDPEGVPDVELATASFPCTDLSLAGSRLGIHEGESSAFWGFCRVLEGMGRRRPRCILIENVTGFLTSHGGRDFEQSMLSLNKLGYAVDPVVVDARWFVPQSRQRLFVIGTQCEVASNESSCRESQLRPKAIVEFIRSHSHIEWRFNLASDPPQKCSLRLTDILEDLPDDSAEWWSRERVDYLYKQMSDRHRAIADQMIGASRWSFGTVFRRVRRQPDGIKRSMGELRTDGIAGCLRTPKGGSGRQILFKAGFGRKLVRLLTPRECARLMGADEFNVTGSLNDALFGFGDAVCVPVVEWISQHFLVNLLRHRKSPSTQAIAK